MGAGAIGSLFGGLLTEAGHDVILIARGAHLEGLRRRGLTVIEEGGRRTIPVKAVGSPGEVGGVVDLFLLTVKAYDTATATQQLKPHLSGSTTLLSLQNGLGLEPLIEGEVGRGHLMRGVTVNAALLTGPGEVERMGRGITVLGEWGEKVSERVREVAGAMREAGLEVEATDNIIGLVWIKALINSAINPFGALTGLRNGELLDHPPLKSAMLETVREGQAVAESLKVSLREDVEGLMLDTARRTAKNRNSMLRDVERGRPTEIDYLNGAISKLGRAEGVPTPLNDLLTGLVKGLGSSGRFPSL